jgi:hypothetical protein
LTCLCDPVPNEVREEESQDGAEGEKEEGDEEERVKGPGGGARRAHGGAILFYFSVLIGAKMCVSARDSVKSEARSSKSF